MPVYGLIGFCLKINCYNKSMVSSGETAENLKFEVGKVYLILVERKICS